jgi:lysophospholipase L1-like esterase
MRTRYVTGLLVTAVVVAMLPGTADARSGDRTYAVALGDSLSVGYQPNRNGPTTQGYASELARLVSDRVIPGLTLKNFGCAGETAASMITGERSPCRYAAGSQLAAAEAFLASHRGDVAYVTFDIGTNDLFERCLDPTSLTFDTGCVRHALPHVQRRIARIASRLHTAAGGDVPIAAMTDHDPLLGLWAVDGGRARARMSLRSFRALNAGFAETYRRNGVVTARVDRTFHITRWKEVHGAPANVAIACRWTWFCSRRFFSDPHPNDAGYERIARTFASVLLDRLR